MIDQARPKKMLASTARWTAAVRAMESAREDRLFFDPFAGALAGPEGTEWMGQRSAASAAPILLRIKFFDDWLQHIARDEGIRQFVVPAAGLDTRAFRLDWPEQTSITELDQPSVLQYKEQVLNSAGAKPNCLWHTIGTDLAENWQEPLIASGFDPRQPSCWLLEGFLFYLSVASITRILDGVSALAAPSSRLGLDIVNGATLTSPLTKAWIEMQAKSGAPWIGTLDDPAVFLAERGWKATLTQPGEPTANYGRWPFPVIPSERRDLPHHWLVTAEKTPTS